jgi:hypothetical protein
LSVAASRLVHVIGPLFLGLTPQAMSLPPLRGWVFLFHLCSWGSRPRLRICRRFAASWPQSMKIMATWWRLEPLCGFALSPHEDTVTRAHSSPLRGFTPPAKESVASRAHMPQPRGSAGFSMTMWRPWHTNRGLLAPARHLMWVAAGRRAPWVILGQRRRRCRHLAWGVSPRNRGRAPSIKPRSGDRHLAWGVSPRNEAGRHPSSREAAADI